MKAKEIKAIHLMVGDWVNAVRIGDKENYLESIRLESEQISEGYSFLAIPLTEDILKANDWYYEEGLGYYSEYWKGHDGYVYLKVLLDCTGFIKYVHQFQHALRLYGLNKLADNFKVEE